MQIHCARSAPSFCISPARKNGRGRNSQTPRNLRAKNLAANRKSREVLSQNSQLSSAHSAAFFLIQMNSNKNQSHTISSLRAHTRASASFRFSSSPFTPPSHHFVSQCVRCEGKAYFILHLPLHPRNEGSPLLQKNRIFSFFLRRKVEKCGGFRPKVFTQKQLIHNHLHKMGEEVKAKNEKPLCTHYARVRPPHLHSEHRAPHLLRPEPLPPLRGAHSPS